MALEDNLGRVEILRSTTLLAEETDRNLSILAVYLQRLGRTMWPESLVFGFPRVQQGLSSTFPEN